ncbi:MAG: hypothetical protein WC177_05005, partial [Bacilli bacterium]
TTIVDKVKGNGDLTYPVGLLTADEAAMAGLVYAKENRTNYLYTGQYWWSLSPSYMNSSGWANLWGVSFYGDMYNDNTDGNTLGVRPVVSISSATQVSGTGSATDPFKSL